jgi:hypothetical protein
MNLILLRDIDYKIRRYTKQSGKLELFEAILCKF